MSPDSVPSEDRSASGDRYPSGPTGSAGSCRAPYAGGLEAGVRAPPELALIQRMIRREEWMRTHVIMRNAKSTIRLAVITTRARAFHQATAHRTRDRPSRWNPV